MVCFPTVFVKILLHRIKMNSEDTSKETLIFLDFNDKLSSELLQNKVFIRLVNLEKEDPLVQVNDIIFKGTYNYSIGTNLFFKKSPNEGPREFPFSDSTKFKLDFMESQTKVLSCKQMKVPASTTQLPANQENIQFNFKWDYKELLKKLENGTLDLQDMVAKKDNESEALSENNTINKENLREIETEPLEAMDVSDNAEIEDTKTNMSDSEDKQREPVSKPEDELREAYENLLILARTPVKRDIAFEDSPCDPLFKTEHEYKSIECKILEPPLFSYWKRPTKSKKLEECVNLERCVTLGLLSPSDVYPRKLSEEEKKLIMRLENFENLDLAARYSVLKAYTEELEKQVNSNSSEENSVKDEFDRTPLETLQVFKRLLVSLQRRIQEIEMFRK